MEKNKIQNLVLSALFLSLGMVLPFFTMQIKELGDTLLPMHFAVMLCGLVCGRRSGAAVGAILPFLRAFCFGMPPLFPNAVWMSCELLTYGFAVALAYQTLRVTNLWAKTSLSLCISMIAGRIVWGIVKALLLCAAGKFFSFSLFLAEGFLDALPGIVLQLLLIPGIMLIIYQRRVQS